MNKDKVFGSVFMAVGAIVIVLGVVIFFSLSGDYRNLSRLSKESLTAQGTVIDFEIVKEYDRSRTDFDREYRPYDMTDTYEIMTIAYTVDGREYSFQVKKLLTDETRLFAKGDTVDVFYDADAPEDAALLTRNGGWEAELQNVKRGMVAAPILCGVLGVCFIACGGFVRKKAIAEEQGSSWEEDGGFSKPGVFSRFFSTLNQCFGGIVVLLFGSVLLVVAFVAPVFKQLDNESKVETVPAEVVYYGENQAILEYEVDGEKVRGAVSSQKTGFLIEGQTVWITCDHHQPDQVYLSQPEMDSDTRRASYVRIGMWIFGGLLIALGIYVIIFTFRNRDCDTAMIRKM